MSKIFQSNFWQASGYKIYIIIILLIIFFATLRAGKKINGLLVTKKYISPAIASLFYSIFKWIVTILFFLLIIQQMGFSIISVWTVVSAMAAMLAVGFVAFWSVLSNILCTLMLLIFQPFRIGDEVEVIDPSTITGLGGVVKNINLMFTTLRSENESEVVDIQVPNNIFFQKFLRKKVGKNTISLEKQIFETQSLLKKEPISQENKNYK